MTIATRSAVLLAAASFACADADRKLLVIGIDGLRPDAMEIAECPNIDWLVANGSYSPDAQCEDLTFSGPNWSTILHGVHRDKHNVTTNDYSGSRFDLYPDLFTRLEAHDPAWFTVRLTTWDQIYLKQPTGADEDIFHDYTQDGDQRVTDECAQILRGTHPTIRDDPDAVFIYLADVDVAGHTYGFHPSRQGYMDEIEDNDAQVGQLLDAIRARPAYTNEDWLIILTSDHGGSIDGSHHGNTPEKRRIPFIVSGPAAALGCPWPGARNADTVKTALAFMGVPIDPSWGLDGHVVGLGPSGRPPAALGANLVFNGDAEFDRGFTNAPPDQYASGWDDPGPDQVTIVQWGSPDGWPGYGDPGPPDRGANFFSGGVNDAGVSTMAQAIDLAPLTEWIDAGICSFTLAGYLGGYACQNDRARVDVAFLDAGGGTLLLRSIGPVTAAERNNRTALLPREATDPVPVGARGAVVTVTSIRAAGFVCDGYADSLSLVLDALCVADCTADGALNVFDFLCFQSAFGAGSPDADCTGDGSLNIFDFLCFQSFYSLGCP